MSASANGYDRSLLQIVGFACVLVAVAGNHFYPDWGRAILLSTVVFAGSIVLWRKYWGSWWFWGPMIGLLLIHSLLLAQLRALLNSQNISSVFLCAAGEVLLISALMSVPLVVFCSKPDDRG
jgi:hypothetical protein